MMNAWGTPLKKSSPTSIGGQCSRFTSDSVNKTTNRSSDRFCTSLRDGNNHKSTSSGGCDGHLKPSRNKNNLVSELLKIIKSVNGWLMYTMQPGKLGFFLINRS